jgi:hypothetical protein
VPSVSSYIYLFLLIKKIRTNNYKLNVLYYDVSCRAIGYE